jgi:hypothetical protein
LDPILVIATSNLVKNFILERSQHVSRTADELINGVANKICTATCRGLLASFRFDLAPCVTSTCHHTHQSH